MPPEQIAKVEESLEAADLKYTAELYPGAAHGWTMSDIPAYNAGAEASHWDPMLALFKRTSQK